MIPLPATVLSELGSIITTASFYQAVTITMQRAVFGFFLAIIVGLVVGVAVSRSDLLRRAVGSIITGLQSMPSIAWFPFAILLFGLNESAILFVIVLGGGAGDRQRVDLGNRPHSFDPASSGKVLGAKGVAAWRHVVLPAALPAFVSGLKQGWAFAWRSLMAGELLVTIASRPSIGVQLKTARDSLDATALLAMMIVVLVIGIVVDSVLFGSVGAPYPPEPGSA